MGDFYMTVTDNPNYLIVYGTLRSDFVNPFSAFLQQHSRYVGDTSFPGLLFDLGTYPGATYAPDSPTQVYGSVYDMADQKQTVLAYLDDYEGVGEAFDQPNEYMRTVIPVRCNNTLIDCWVYLYNHPTLEKQVIESGQYTVTA